MDDIKSSLDERFPPNNNKPKEEDKRAKPVVKGETSVVKEGPGKSFFRALFNGSPSDVVNYLIYDRLIPMLQDGIYGMFAGSLERAIYGNSSRDRERRSHRNDPYYYNSITDGDRRRGPKEDDRSYGRGRYSVPEVLFHDREDAEDVLNALLNYFDEYGTVPVSYYLDISDQKSEYTDNDWGWTSMAGVKVRPKGSAWYIDLPRPVNL